MLVEHSRVIDRVLTRRVRVQCATQRLELERNLLCAAPFGPLEHHVLEEMRYAHALARLVKRCGAHPCPERDRPYSRNEFREHGQAVREYGAAKRGVRRGGRPGDRKSVV